MSSASQSSPRAILSETDRSSAETAPRQKIPWLSIAHFCVAGLQLVALVYLAIKWQKPVVDTNPVAQATNLPARDLDQNLIKGWHETLSLLKSSDEVNAKLRLQIEELEQRLAQMEPPPPAAVPGPLAEKPMIGPQKAKE